MKQLSSLTISSFIFILTFYATKTFEKECNCGIPNISKSPRSVNRIMGGHDAEVNKYPWMMMIGLFTKNEQRGLCGGTLISKRHVMSAAHCFLGERLKDIRVMIGGHNQYPDPKIPEIWINVIKIVNHPKFLRLESEWAKNDVSILTLSENIVFTDTVSPACLPSDPKELYPYRQGTVAGWGYIDTEGKGTFPQVLQEVKVTIWPNGVCKNVDVYGQFVSNGNICASRGLGLRMEEATGGGDSGGPLTVKENGKYTLVGVLSGSLRGKPSVFGRITDKLEWIKSQTSGVFDSRCNILS